LQHRLEDGDDDKQHHARHHHHQRRLKQPQRQPHLGIKFPLLVNCGLLGNKEKADRQKAISDIVALENALDMYRLDNGRYPTTEQGLEALIQQPANMADARNYRTGGYIKRLPKDPWGNDYQYLSPGEKGLFDVYTLGADGQENGEGAGADIGNWNLQEFQ
jgi:general secretion pathway protein G